MQIPLTLLRDPKVRGRLSFVGTRPRNEVLRGLRLQIAVAVRFWPKRLSTRPYITERSQHQVKPGTFIQYAKALLPFLEFVNRSVDDLDGLTDADVEERGVEYAIQCADAQLRVFHSAFKHFFPDLRFKRITAELKGLEKKFPSTPTTPLTYPLLIALVVYTRAVFGLSQAVGLLVGFFGMLRAQEIIRIRSVDVMLRGGHVQLTTIRLLITKSRREQIIQFAPNSVPERALAFLLRHNPHGIYGQLFGFRRYTDLHGVFVSFRLHFRCFLHLTPHCLRSGGATFMRLQGQTLPVITEVGRWDSPAVCRGYIDVAATLLPECLAAEASVYPKNEGALVHILVAPWY